MHPYFSAIAAASLPATPLLKKRYDQYKLAKLEAYMQGKLLEDREASHALRYFIGVSKFQMLVWGDAQTAKEHIHYKEFLKIMVGLSIGFIKSINITGNKITSGRPFVQEANNITKDNQDTSSRHIDRGKIRNFLIKKPGTMEKLLASTILRSN